MTNMRQIASRLSPFMDTIAAITFPTNRYHHAILRILSGKGANKPAELLELATECQLEYGYIPFTDWDLSDASNRPVTGMLRTVKYVVGATPFPVIGIVCADRILYLHADPKRPECFDIPDSWTWSVFLQQHRALNMGTGILPQTILQLYLVLSNHPAHHTLQAIEALKLLAEYHNVTASDFHAKVEHLLGVKAEDDRIEAEWADAVKLISHADSVENLQGRLQALADDAKCVFESETDVQTPLYTLSNPNGTTIDISVTPRLVVTSSIDAPLDVSGEFNIQDIVDYIQRTGLDGYPSRPFPPPLTHANPEMLERILHRLDGLAWSGQIIGSALEELCTLPCVNRLIGVGLSGQRFGIILQKFRSVTVSIHGNDISVADTDGTWGRFMDQQSELLPVVRFREFLKAVYAYGDYDGLGWPGINPVVRQFGESPMHKHMEPEHPMVPNLRNAIARGEVLHWLAMGSSKDGAVTVDKSNGGMAFTIRGEHGQICLDFSDGQGSYSLHTLLVTFTVNERLVDAHPWFVKSNELGSGMGVANSNLEDFPSAVQLIMRGAPGIVQPIVPLVPTTLLSLIDAIDKTVSYLDLTALLDRAKDGLLISDYVSLDGQETGWSIATSSGIVNMYRDRETGYLRQDLPATLRAEGNHPVKNINHGSCEGNWAETAQQIGLWLKMMEDTYLTTRPRTLIELVELMHTPNDFRRIMEQAARDRAGPFWDTIAMTNMSSRPDGTIKYVLRRNAKTLSFTINTDSDPIKVNNIQCKPMPGFKLSTRGWHHQGRSLGYSTTADKFLAVLPDLVKILEAP